ncbi:MAG: GNAT family acetyltransferase [Rhizobiales bacterium]|nr:GNAT family acetyltransferase [Hyphomicrobiales bacterium]
MKVYEFLARAFFALIAFGLVILSGGLIVFAGIELVNAFEAAEADVGRSLLDSVGYMVIAVAVFEVAKYILEEEALDPTEMRHTGEARRSITKFLSTIIIAVFLEALVTIFQASKSEDLSQMLYPTILLFAAVALIVGLGAYQRLSASAERDVRSSPEAAAEERAELDKH